MNVVNAITSKPDWKTKINKKATYNKWKKESIQLGESELIVEFALDYLKYLSTKSSGQIYEDDDNYDWICNVKSDPNIVCAGNFQCNCECYFCGESGTQQEKPTLDEMIENWDLDVENDKEQVEELQNMLNLECTCEIFKNLKISKLNYLNKFVHTSNKLVNKSQKAILLKGINKLQSEQESTIGLDFQPGTNNTVVNIIHPATTCYVNGLSKITNNLFNTDAILQWLPVNYSMQTNKFTSHIKNVSHIDHSQLYSSLETIFATFIPHFQEALNVLHQNGKLEIERNLLSYETLQVIPKIASTILTPDNPESNGTSWHLEGIREENIICTGIYYVDMNNITQSKLKFRTTITQHMDIHYAQCCDANVDRHYGLGDYKNGETETTIELGEINTNSGMSIIFPNCFQHKVDSFKLADPTKEGHRLILVFFLVDPEKHVISTEDVDNTGISLTDAKKLREILMFDRKFEVGDQEKFFERGFTLCEH